MTILFTDFDGVTHRMPGPGLPVATQHARHFEFVDALHELLKDYAEVRIVVSSTWRHEYHLDELRALLGPLGKLVIGTTGRGGFSRYEEIRAAAYAHRRPPWIAVDDDVTGWGERDLERLVACSPQLGLGEPGRLEELADKLRRAAEIHARIERGTE